MNQDKDRIQYIRDEEKTYHDFCYENFTLFKPGSWLNKPVQTVMNLMAQFDDKKNVSVLDLGCGVGRNSIPMAQRLNGQGGKVVCVDLLDSAIERLIQYSEQHHVADLINPYKMDISDFIIHPEEYDYIVAVSALEHVDSQKTFENVLFRMEEGTKSKGINCIIVNTEEEEVDEKTGEHRDVLVEVNLSIKQTMRILRKIYKDWEELLVVTKPLEFEIRRQGKPVLLRTKAITFVVRKK
ncbi:class I SAM-dependent methyltransferase [Sporolactobacillus pectinivorans]|uniref:class I SAM-dependent methyltransferase n=1 Tax=Sporolactobacillus pectinivorans TaxID=1591408 RepID=UPI000C264A77|nr:class I SAM-dependent methyltransferase [Sporolactobacillus pectinivorans]